MGSEIIVIPAIFLGLPWIIMHYITKWKTAATLTNDDEKMLGDMQELARRLEDRLETVERLVASDNPDFTPRRIDHDSEDYMSENVRRLERNR
jgi:phage shock protein B